MLKTLLTGNVLRYEVGLTIFCPGCKGILDWQSSVCIELVQMDTNKRLEGSVFCDRCFDRGMSSALDKIATQGKAKYGPCEVSVTDGREWMDERTKLVSTVSPDFSPRDVLWKNGPVVVAGYPVTLPDFAWADWFVYHDTAVKLWHFIEPNTGLSLGQSGTQKGAIMAAARKFAKVTREQFDASVQRGHRSNARRAAKLKKQTLATALGKKDSSLSRSSVGAERHSAAL